MKLSDADIERIAERVAEKMTPAPTTPSFPILIHPAYPPNYGINQYVAPFRPYVTC